MKVWHWLCLLVVWGCFDSGSDRVLRVTLEGDHANRADSVMTVAAFQIHVAAVWIDGRSLICGVNGDGERGWIEIIPSNSLEFETAPDPVILHDEECGVELEYEGGPWSLDADEYEVELGHRPPPLSRISLYGVRP